MNIKIAQTFASVFNIGRLPVAPGTWGSLFALLTWLILIPYISSLTLILINLILFVVGVITSSRIEKELKENDPSLVVIDEWVGQWIALFFLPQSIIWGIVAFGLFRIFDIWKPYPIYKFDKMQGGWGIMMDDVLAGIYALLIIQILRFLIL